MAYVSLYPKEVHLKLDEIKQDTQDATSDYLVKTPTPNKNLPDNTYVKIRFIKAFLQTHQSCPTPPTKPVSKCFPPTSQEHITPDIRSEVRDTKSATDTESAPNLSSPSTMSTLDHAPPSPKIPPSNPPVYLNTPI